MTLSTTSHSSDAATGLITGVQPVHFLPNAEVVTDDRIATGDSRSRPRKPGQDLGRGAAVGVTDSVSDAATPTRITSTTPALPPWAPRAEQQAVDGSSPAEGSVCGQLHARGSRQTRLAPGGSQPHARSAVKHQPADVVPQADDPDMYRSPRISRDRSLGQRVRLTRRSPFKPG